MESKERMHHKKSEEEAEKTLQLLEQMPRAEAPPFLHTRIMARLEESSTPSLVWRPWLLGAVTILLIVNTFSLIQLSNRGAASNSPDIPTTQDAFIETYSLQPSGYQSLQQ